MGQTAENGYMMARCLPVHRANFTSAQLLREFCWSLLQTWKRSQDFNSQVFP